MVERGGNARVLALRGELDAYAAPELQERLADALEPGDGDVVVDLSDVTFLDSTILGLLAAGLRRAREQGNELRLVLPSGPARRIFELTGLEHAFPHAEPSSGPGEVFLQP